jgi:hypothetical protein
MPSAFSCIVCGLNFNDSLSHGMHLLTKKHLDKVGKSSSHHNTNNKSFTSSEDEENFQQQQLRDLKMLIERKRAEKEMELFGKNNSSAGSRRDRLTSGYFGQLQREPAPHDEVVKMMVAAMTEKK